MGGLGFGSAVKSPTEGFSTEVSSRGGPLSTTLMMTPSVLISCLDHYVGTYSRIIKLEPLQRSTRDALYRACGCVGEASATRRPRARRSLFSRLAPQVQRPGAVSAAGGRRPKCIFVPPHASAANASTAWPSFSRRHLLIKTRLGRYWAYYIRGTRARVRNMTSGEPRARRRLLRAPSAMCAHGRGWHGFGVSSGSFFGPFR